MTEGGLLKIAVSPSSSSTSTVGKSVAGLGRVEYLIAHFGVKAPHPSRVLEVVRAVPADACEAIENDVKGKVVLVARGNCAFVRKSETVQTAGGAVLLVGSLNAYIVRMGVEPRWKGLNTAIPVVMISRRAFSVVEEAVAAGEALQVGFDEDGAVSSAVWEGLEKLAAGEGWPRSEAYIRKRALELREEHRDWPDRLLAVEDAYAAVVKKEKLEPAKSEL